MSTNNATSNFSFTADIERQFQICMASGVCAILANLLIIAVFLSKAQFRQHYQMFIALAIGDCFNGIAFFVTGFMRTGSRRVEMPATAMECMLKPTTTLWIIGTQLPALCTLALSVERYLAVSKPFWYRTTWTHSKQQMTIAACFLLTALWILFAFVSAAQFGDEIRTPTGACFISKATGPFYTSAYYALIIAFHLCAFIINVYALSVGLRKSVNRGDIELLKAEAIRIRLILMISALSVLLVAIPNTLLWSLVMKWLPTELLTPLRYHVGYFYVLFSANSAINLAVYLWLSNDFRSQFIKLANLKPLFKSASNCLHWRRNVDSKS